MSLAVLIVKTKVEEPAASAIALSLGLSVGALIFATAYSSLRLLKYGQATAGVLTKIWAPAGGVIVRKKGGKLVAARTIVRFVFLDQNQNLVGGRGRLPSDATPGQAVTVVYDPSRPKRNALYPVEGFDVGY